MTDAKGMKTERIERALDDLESFLHGRADKAHRTELILKPARAELAALKERKEGLREVLEETYSRRGAGMDLDKIKTLSDAALDQLVKELRTHVMGDEEIIYPTNLMAAWGLFEEIGQDCSLRIEWQLGVPRQWHCSIVLHGEDVDLFADTAARGIAEIYVFYRLYKAAWFCPTCGKKSEVNALREEAP